MLNPFIKEDKMNHVKKLNQYFKELARTYHLFFKSAPLIATLVLLLAPLQAVVPLIAVAAGQKVIDQVTNHSPFMEMIIVWIVATAFQQFLPSLSTMVQGILTDKLTGFINISLMKKSEDLQSIRIFDDSKYFDDLQMLRDDASWRPVNLIVFGVSVLQSFLTLAFMLVYLARYNWWLALLLLVVMVPQSISYYRIQQQSFETMVERSKNARYLHYYSSLLLDRRDAKEVRLFNMFPKIIEKYTTLFEQTKRDVNQIRKKQLAVSSLFVLLTVGVFGYGFYWFTNSVRTGALEVGVLLMFVSVIGYMSTSMARVVEDSSLLYDSLLWIEKYFNFLEYHDDFENGTDLSGGQWQKIALARDLYANGKIEFLDEPTAALDAKSEAEIYERFLRENSQKTIFFVTHRLSAVKFADKVLFLDSGKVSGFDTHANLLNKNAKYQEMYNLQKNAYI